ncbi:acyl-CoA dehydrogenase, partial [Streptomyces sp. MCAF7]
MTGEVSDCRPSYALAADFERVLGDPAASGGPFSHAETVEHEELGALPPGAVDLVRSWGFSRYLVPEHFGGGLRNLEQL